MVGPFYLSLTLSCWRLGSVWATKELQEKACEPRIQGNNQPWGQVLPESREEHRELERTHSFNYAWRTRLSPHTLKAVFDKKSCYYFSMLFEKQLGAQESLILGKLFCFPHQLSDVNAFPKMEVKRLQSISPEMGMAKFSAIGFCDWFGANAFDHFPK